jgi:hypothetical protein
MTPNPPTPPARKKKEPRPLDISRDELNLAEYPLSLVSKRIPEGVKHIEYEDWVTIEGQQRRVRWLVSSTAVYGLPAGADQDILVALLQVAYERGFKDQHIPIPSTYGFLKQLGWDDRQESYQRLMKGLERWAGVTVYAENALWSRKDRSYVKKKTFGILKYEIIERKLPDGRTVPVLGHVTFDDELWRSIREGNIKSLDLHLYRQLPTPLARRLFRYLDKKRYRGRFFSMNLVKLGAKLGLAQAALKRYTPGKLRQLLTPALESLKERGFLASYSYQPGAVGQKLAVVFAKLGEEPAGRGEVTPGSSDDELKRDYLVDQVLAVTRDEHSRGYYSQKVRELPEDVIWALLAETKEAEQEGRIRTTPGRFFTDLVERHLGHRPRNNA